MALYLPIMIPVLAACQAIPAEVITQPGATSTSGMTATLPVLSATLEATAEPTRTAAPTQVPTQTSLCPPFDGWDFEALDTAVTNPFHPPPLGSDDPHQGADFSLIDPVGGFATNGQEVHAIVSGKVVMVMNDRFPYGNAILVESEIGQYPQDWLGSLVLPEVPEEPVVSSALSCPSISRPEWDSKNVSVYSLYAHMLNSPEFSTGDAISCGDELGQIGQSGNALNPHLHLEIRVGPAGAIDGSMAHYDVTASDDEMANYCLWRISGLFVAKDPLPLLAELP